MGYKNQAWREGTLVVDGNHNVSFTRTELLLSAHEHHDKPSIRESILFDVEVTDAVDGMIRNMMKSSIRA
jgi:hypothetical protein